MNPRQTLTQFLHAHQGMPFGEDYHLTYNDILCSAYIIKYDKHQELTIKPIYSNQDIGAGDGQSITKEFPLEDIKKDIEKERI